MSSTPPTDDRRPPDPGAEGPQPHLPPIRETLHLSRLQWRALVVAWAVFVVVGLDYVHHYLGTAHFL